MTRQQMSSNGDTHHPSLLEQRPSIDGTPRAPTSASLDLPALSTEPSKTDDSYPVENFSPGAARGWKFRLCIIAIVICSFIIALDLSGTSTSLPIIVHDLKGSQFEWVGSAYSLSATAFMPLCGGLAQVFGRRSVMLAQVFFFALGSALSGAAPSLNFLIAGRTVQGLGAGGINTMTQIILSDLVPLKERGKYNGFVALGFGFATATAPVISGSLADRGQWRWFFYMNIPICAIAAAMVWVSFDIKVPRRSLKEKLETLDWFGNVLIIACTTAIVIALTWGGIQFSWSSPHVLVPLILGNVGLVLFMIYEAIVPRYPVVPLQLFNTWTGISGYLQSFINSFCLLGLLYYLPVYFQACKDASPVRSGIDLFGICYTTVPFGAVFGISVTKTGRYRPQLWLSWVFMLLGAGLLSSVHASTGGAKTIGYSTISGMGIGILTVVTYYPILAPIPLSLNTNAIGLYMFLRYLAQVWGVTVGGTILQNELKQRLPSEFIALFPNGTSIAYSIIPAISTLEEPLKSLVQSAFADGLRVFWQVLLGLSALGFVSCTLMKGLPLYTTMDDGYALKQRSDTGDVEGSLGGATGLS